MGGGKEKGMEPEGKTGGKNRMGIFKRGGKDWARRLVKAANVVAYPTLSSRNRTGQKEIRSLIKHGSLANKQISKRTNKPLQSTHPYEYSSREHIKKHDLLKLATIKLIKLIYEEERKRTNIEKVNKYSCMTTTFQTKSPNSDSHFETNSHHD